MSIYIAAPSDHHVDAAAVADLFRKLGIDVTHKWWTQVRDDREAGRSDADLEPVRRYGIASDCRRGVSRATCVLWLALKPSRGAAIECGIAFGLGIPVVILGDAETLMADLAHERCDDLDSAVDAIIRLHATIGT